MAICGLERRAAQLAPINFAMFGIQRQTGRSLQTSLLHTQLGLYGAFEGFLVGINAGSSLAIAWQTHNHEQANLRTACLRQRYAETLAET
jgi:hypothetical protein